VQQGVVNSGNGGISVAAGTYSGLMLAARITLLFGIVSNGLAEIGSRQRKVACRGMC
jgi:hypothetical protein